MGLTNKVVVITGATGGIGRLLTQKMDQLGATCVLLERSLPLFDELPFVNKARHSLYECDMQNEFNVEKVAREIGVKFDKIDCLFNVAGIGIYKAIGDLSVDEWNTSLSINITAPFVLSKYLLPSLERAKNSMIFNIGSGMGVIPSGGRVAYCASKFALRGMSLTLSKELKVKGVDVCLLTLGSVMTPFGTGGLEHRKQLAEKGKKYLDPNDVVNKIVEITESDNRESEYVMYPTGYAS